MTLQDVLMYFAQHQIDIDFETYVKDNKYIEFNFHHGNYHYPLNNTYTKEEIESTMIQAVQDIQKDNIPKD